MKENNFLLRIFLGSVFLSAGVYRIFNWNQALKEFSRFPPYLVYFLIIFTVILEIIGGLCFIFNIKIKKISLFLIIFMVMALSEAIITSGKDMILKSGELFAFDLTPTDFFLHFTYLIILIFFWSQKKSEN